MVDPGSRLEQSGGQVVLDGVAVAVNNTTSKRLVWITGKVRQGQERGALRWSQRCKGDLERVNPCTGVLQDDERCLGEQNRVRWDIGGGEDAQTFSFGGQNFDDTPERVGVAEWWWTEVCWGWRWCSWRFGVHSTVEFFVHRGSGWLENWRFCCNRIDYSCS